MKDARPHPGPLPQERENRSAGAGEIEHAKFIACLEAKSSEAALARETNEFQKRAESSTLSSGERAGVRASVKPIFFTA